MKAHQHTLPIISIYAIYVALALAGVALAAWGQSNALVAWSVLRWLVRAGVVVTTGWALIRWRREPRPLWTFAWLGFAVYELVAVLLIIATSARVEPYELQPVMIALSLLLVMLAFALECAAGVWASLRSVRVAAYTIFPHAALTATLFLLSGVIPVDELPGEMYFVLLGPLVLAGVIATGYSYTPTRYRWYMLFGGAIACQVLTAVAMGPSGPPMAFSLFVLLFVGLFFLILPLVLNTVYRGILDIVSRYAWYKHIPAMFLPLDPALYKNIDRTEIDIHQTESVGHLEYERGESMSTQQPDTPKQASANDSSAQTESAPAAPTGPSRLDRFYKTAVVVLTTLVVLAVALMIARSMVYKVHEYERGLHLRGGRFLGVTQPGWHTQIPLVDTVILVKTNERLGYVEQIPAMTSDNVTMDVSLQYTYKVNNPEQYALQVDDPERIVFEFVQGKLRDVVNTKAMADIMENRAVMNQEVMDALKAREEQYGVQFITVQMQSASPPQEVLTAIKDRMVAIQRQEQAQAEAVQRQTQADADLYAAQKQADAEAYQITTTAAAEAERMKLTADAEKTAIHNLVVELEDQGELGEAIVEYLMAQELKENSKWVLGGGDGASILDLR